MANSTMTSGVGTAPVIDKGQGEPTLVFLHYFSGAASSWQAVIDRLCDRYRCVAPNLPGFGQAAPLEHPSIETYADAVRQTLAQLGIERCVVIGHSMGGKIALKLAADDSTGQVQQVVLVAPSPATQEPMPAEDKARMLTDHTERAAAVATVDSAVHAPLPAEQRELAIQTHTLAETSAWRWWLLQGMDNSIAEQMSDITIPVTVIASADDPVIPLNVIQRDVVDLISQATLINVGGVGHLIPLEAPDLLGRHIEDQVR